MPTWRGCAVTRPPRSARSRKPDGSTPRWARPRRWSGWRRNQVVSGRGGAGVSTAAARAPRRQSSPACAPALDRSEFASLHPHLTRFRTFQRKVDFVPLAQRLGCVPGPRRSLQSIASKRCGLSHCQKSSRAAEFHRRALPEPYVSLSTHTAPSIRAFTSSSRHWGKSPGVRRWRTALSCPCGSSRQRLATGQDWIPLPLRSSFITKPSALLRAAPPLCLASVLWSSSGPPTWDVSLAIKTTGSHVPCKSPSRSHAAFEPDAAWAGLQVSAQTYPEINPKPRF